MQGAVLKYIIFLFLFSFITPFTQAQDVDPESHNVLFLNSYSISYTWADSVGSGVQSVFSQRKDINLFIEFLDAKRFGNTTFSDAFRLFKRKYKNLKFDVALISDNDALDFMMQYGDSIFPGVPVVFCGINNPEDYQFENSNYYGILDGIDLKDEIDMITTVMPDVKTLYFISDSATTTSLINLKYIKQIEPEFEGKVSFSYLSHFSLNSLLDTVSHLEKGSAVALINYYQDLNGNPLNPELVNAEVIQKSPVPVFMESETLLGKGIAGGIIIKGRDHGSEAARLALKFLDIPSYKPEKRIIQPENKYYFDYKVLKKFNIETRNLPPGSVIVNKPQIVFLNYLRYILPLLVIIGLLLIVVFVLLINTQKRRKAEQLVQQKLSEIQDKNVMLEEAHHHVSEMNIELEEVNEHLSLTNEELRLAKVKSEESDRLKSAFLANMSHEIRTPLNAIIGFSSLLGDIELSNDDRENYFRIINSNSAQLLNIIEDILDLSKIEAGQMKIFPEVFSVNHILEDLVETFIKSRNNTEVTLSLKTSNQDVMLRTDPARFKQILTNLISNALKFTKKGFVDVGYDLNADTEIIFYVRDSGVGIDEQNIKRVFSRFWKSDENSEYFHSGAGLGLAICSSLCEALGGKIWAQSTPGEGSTFFVSFRDISLQEMEPVQEEVLPVTYQDDWSHLTIAIAEDEYSNQYLLSRILKQMNAKVICFANGKELLDFIIDPSRKKIDIILMDLKMPVMDGYTSLRLIREITREIPVIAQTAYAMVEDIEKIKASSFNDYIVKPIKPAQLIEKIKKLL